MALATQAAANGATLLVPGTLAASIHPNKQGVAGAAATLVPAVK